MTPVGFEAAPPRPWIETDRLDAWLDATGADAQTRRFAREMATDGVGLIDLRPEILPLCDAVIAQTDPYFRPGVARIQDAWRREPAVRDLATHPRILEMLSRVYGRTAFPFQTLHFLRGSQQGLHDDDDHFSSDPQGFMCGVWVALEDVKPGAGPLTYLAGSHRGEGGEPRLALIKKGQAMVWAAKLRHGGLPIETEGSTRRSQVTHYYFEGCTYHTPRLAGPGGRHLRLPPDVRSGGWVWPTNDGARVPLRPGFVAVAALDRYLRRVHRFSA